MKLISFGVLSVIQLSFRREKDKTIFSHHIDIHIHFVLVSEIDFRVVENGQIRKRAFSSTKQCFPSSLTELKRKIQPKEEMKNVKMKEKKIKTRLEMTAIEIFYWMWHF